VAAYNQNLHDENISQEYCTQNYLIGQEEHLASCSSLHVLQTIVIAENSEPLLSEIGVR
jgi:hypothetical protein